MTAQPPLLVHHAGVIGTALEREIVPAFKAAAGLAVERTGGHSVALARRILAGETQPDVYISADAEVNAQLFVGGSVAPWFLTFARVAMTLIYSPRSRFRVVLDAAAAGETAWYDVLQQPGFALRRNSAADDPGGYRAVLVAQLAERHYDVPGLARAILGEDDNPAQLLTGGFAELETGAADALFLYDTVARDRALPQIALPEAINLGDPARAAFYTTAAYTTPDGYTFRGTPARLSVTIPRLAPNPAGAAAFVSFLLSVDGQAALRSAGFRPASILAGGDLSTLPAALQPLIEGRYDA